MTLLYHDEQHVKFSDVDAAGIVFFSRVYEFAHSALESYFRKSILGWDYWFNNVDFAVPIIQSNAQYSLPLKLNQTFVISLYLVKMGESSLQFRFEILDSEKKLATTIETTHVFVSRNEFKKINIPIKIRDYFSEPNKI